MWERCEWLNAPADVEIGEDGRLIAHSGDRTDFWQTTHYGFQRDSGHAFLAPAPQEFTATLSFDADYQALYDQAGLFVRAEPTVWAKFGIEHTDATHLSVVVTNTLSDWSVVRLDGPGLLTIRVTRIGDALVFERRVGGEWQLVRLAPFPAGVTASVGPYLCAPERSGFVARFWDFSVGEPALRALH